MQRFRGELVFKAHRLLYHSTLGLRVIKKKKKIHNMIPPAIQLNYSGVSRMQGKHCSMKDSSSSSLTAAHSCEVVVLKLMKESCPKDKVQ